MEFEVSIATYKTYWTLRFGIVENILNFVGDMITRVSQQKRYPKQINIVAIKIGDDAIKSCIMKWLEISIWPHYVLEENYLSLNTKSSKSIGKYIPKSHFSLSHAEIMYSETYVDYCVIHHLMLCLDNLYYVNEGEDDLWIDCIIDTVNLSLNIMLLRKCK